jgi:hypothetical protein
MSGGPYHYDPYPRPVERPAPVPVPVAYVAPLTDQRPLSTPVVVVSWVVTIITGLYMLPWAIAASRGKANQWSVFLVSLLFGWTVIGWIVALVLACTAHRPLMGAMLGYRPVAALPPASAPPGWYPNPQGPGRRYWDGVRWTQYFG